MTRIEIRVQTVFNTVLENIIFVPDKNALTKMRPKQKAVKNAVQAFVGNVFCSGSQLLIYSVRRRYALVVGEKL